MRPLALSRNQHRKDSMSECRVITWKSKPVSENSAATRVRSPTVTCLSLSRRELMERNSWLTEPSLLGIFSILTVNKVRRLDLTQLSCWSRSLKTESGGSAVCTDRKIRKPLTCSSFRVFKLQELIGLLAALLTNDSVVKFKFKFKFALMFSRFRRQSRARGLLRASVA